MDARQVNDQLAVSGQIAVQDVATVAAAGFRSMICNRPDGESRDQTDYAAIAAEAQRCGLEIRWQPVMSGHVSDEQGQAFGEIVAALPGPVFAYCRSGTRCIVLWALSQAGQLSTSEIIAAAAAAGYDLSGLAPRLEHALGADTVQLGPRHGHSENVIGCAAIVTQATVGTS